MIDAPRRMLIVDDELDICDCLQHYFTSQGFSVASVFSGEEALEQLGELAADVLLLDINLPGLSGMEVLRRAKESYPNLRVVMVSGLGYKELRDQAKRYGAEGYVTKPFDFSAATWSAVLS